MKTPEENRIACLAAANRWAALAENEHEAMIYEQSRGHHVGSFEARIHIYRMTAETLRREAETGIEHCAYCGGGHQQASHSADTSRPCDCASMTCPWCEGQAAR